MFCGLCILMHVNLKHAQAIAYSSSMAEGLRDHQESNESEVCDDVIDVPNSYS